MSGRIIHLPELSPSDACDLELSALSSRKEFQTEVVFGGPMPAKMIEENTRKRAAFRKARAKVIAKHGVFDEYLQPLLADEKRLKGELEEIRDEIRLLRSARANKL